MNIIHIYTKHMYKLHIIKSLHGSKIRERERQTEPPLAQS